ncbi:Hypothetical protein NocV09_04600080 [Nannochloropsis oceanica]
MKTSGLLRLIVVSSLATGASAAAMMPLSAFSGRCSRSSRSSISCLLLSRGGASSSSGVVPTTATINKSIVTRARGGGPRIFRRQDYFEETEIDRGRCLARMHALVAVQFFLLASFLCISFPESLPRALAPYLLEGGDIVLAQSVGAGSLLSFLLVLLLGKSHTARATFPLNAVLLLGLTSIKSLLVAALTYRYFPPSSSTYAAFPFLFACQAAITQIGLAFLAAYAPSQAENFLPYLLATVLTLLPARPISLLLCLPMPSVMMAAALSFVVSVLVLFVNQSNVRGKAHRGGWEALADMYAKVYGGVGGGRRA